MTPKLNNPDFIFSYYERRISLHAILHRSWSTTTIVSERQFRDNTSDFFQNSLLILYNFSDNVLDIQFLTHSLENSTYNVVALSNTGRALNMESNTQRTYSSMKKKYINKQLSYLEDTLQCKKTNYITPIQLLLTSLSTNFVRSLVRASRIETYLHNIYSSNITSVTNIENHTFQFHFWNEFHSVSSANTYKIL